MIETLEATPRDTQADTKVAFVRLQGISFDRELWQPRYPSLFDYEAAPSGLNLVPSFQVKSPNAHSVQMTLELLPDQPFELRSDGPGLWRMINGEAKVTSSSVTSKSCVLTIEPKTPLVVLQVLCKKSGQTKFSGREEIEGGLFLSIVNDSGVAVVPGKGKPEQVPRGVILITGMDGHHRLKYNLFAGTVYTDPLVVSAELEPEPAFRTPQAQELRARISLALTDLIFVPRADHHKKVSLKMREPATEPATLNVPFLEQSDGNPIPGGCDIHWTSPGSPQRGYLVTSFSMEVRKLTDEAKEDLARLGDGTFRDQLFLRRERDGKFNRELLMHLSELIRERPGFLHKLTVVGDADPTIIDTPICTRINGEVVCSESV